MKTMEKSYEFFFSEEPDLAIDWQLLATVFLEEYFLGRCSPNIEMTLLLLVERDFPRLEMYMKTIEKWERFRERIS